VRESVVVLYCRLKQELAIQDKLVSRVMMAEPGKLNPEYSLCVLDQVLITAIITCKESLTVSVFTLHDRPAWVAIWQPCRLMIHG